LGRTLLEHPGERLTRVSPRPLRLTARLVSMRHARPDDLVALEPLLERLRSFDQLVERTPGSFYRESKGFLHFHIDGEDIWCDVKLSGPSFERVRVTTGAEQRKLVSEVRRTLEA
jgi:hypothetical protein